MNKFVKYGVSLVALTIGVTAANAQDQRPRERGQEAQMERQESGERERGMQRGERGGEKRAQRGDEEQSRDSGERRKRMGQDSDENRERGDRADGRKERGDKERAGRGDDRRDRDRADRGEDGRRDRDRADRRGDDRRDGQRAERGERKGGKRAKVQVNITAEKKTIIRERVVTRAPKRYKRADIDFNLSIGTSIPRSYVFYDLPPVFLEIVPDYQGYDYIVVGDVLLIIDPDTREIVDIIDI
jgi:hypothetical protein